MKILFGAQRSSCHSTNSTYVMPQSLQFTLGTFVYNYHMWLGSVSSSYLPKITQLLCEKAGLLSKAILTAKLYILVSRTTPGHYSRKGLI